jgi:hypothetical protein
MGFRIEEEPIDHLDEHATITIAFTVERILEVSLPDGGLGGIRLTEVAVDSPWIKDYDTIKGEGPTRWLRRFDTSNWGLLSAHDASGRIGGAVIAFNTAGVHMLEGRPDIASSGTSGCGRTNAPPGSARCCSGLPKGGVCRGAA